MYLLLLTSLLLLHTVSAAITSTITVSATSAPISTPTSYSNATTFQDNIVAAHNFYRAQHNTSSLVWNSTLATVGGKWAEGCVFQHSGEAPGENLAAGYANATASIDAWALERESYNWDKPGFSEKTGHFTQLVWSNTTTVGCGVMSCQGDNNTPGWYVVCEYWPRGNIVGDNNQYFVDNVKKQVKGKSTDTVETGSTGGVGARAVERWVLGVGVLVGLVGLL